MTPIRKTHVSLPPQRLAEARQRLVARRALQSRVMESKLPVEEFTDQKRLADPTPPIEGHELRLV